MSTTNTRHIERSVAKERFNPALNESFSESFKTLLCRLRHSLPINHREFITQEIEETKRLHPSYSVEIETLKYLSSLSVLIDLSLQGWDFEIDDEGLTLRMETEYHKEKEQIKYRLGAETSAQFKTRSVRDFIRKMERIRLFEGNEVSIRNLFGNADVLRRRIAGEELICAPYVQRVTENRDEFTGLKLSDIWRYFRYTWSIPYKTMPGRNMYYLVRDSLQPFHPVIGIFALGNSVLNLTVRDDDIGWTIESIKTNLKRQSITRLYEQILSESGGKRIYVKDCKSTESPEEFKCRTSAYADKLLPLLSQTVESSIDEIYKDDLEYGPQSNAPSQEYIDWLFLTSEELRKRSINNKNNENGDWRTEAQSTLFKRKRTAELAKLLVAKKVLNSAQGDSNLDRLNYLLATEKGRRAITVALIANRKRKIGSNMMDIIVCGSIPPYNELLGGKLISILACSPTVIRDYTERYKSQISEIASRMKGEVVIRDSRLAYLGTTSLYAIGSSQYNRIKVPVSDSFMLSFREMGITEGYGTVYFSPDTSFLLSTLLQNIDGGKRISHVFGEGTSPRFRLINRGLTMIGIRASSFLQHYSPRIVYSIDLARNTKEFLMGYDDNLDYGFNLKDEEDVNCKTAQLIRFWYDRWLTTRLTSVDIDARLASFNIDRLLLGNRL